MSSWLRLGSGDGVDEALMPKGMEG
jgi:hypothetical protein